MTMASPREEKKEEEVTKLDNIADSMVKAFFLAMSFRFIKSVSSLCSGSTPVNVYHVMDIVVFVGFSILTYYTSFWVEFLKRN